MLREEGRGLRGGTWNFELIIRGEAWSVGAGSYAIIWGRGPVLSVWSFTGGWVLRPEGLRLAETPAGGSEWSRFREGKTAGSLTPRCAPPLAASGGLAEELLRSRGSPDSQRIPEPPGLLNYIAEIGEWWEWGSSGPRPTLAHVFPPRTDTRISPANVFPRPGYSRAPRLS